MGCDVAATLARFEEKVGGRSDIRDPNAYLLTIAAEEVEKARGLPRGAILSSAPKPQLGGVVRFRPSGEAQIGTRGALADCGLSLPSVLVDWTLESANLRFASTLEVDAHFERYVQNRIDAHTASTGRTPEPPHQTVASSLQSSLDQGLNKI